MFVSIIIPSRGNKDNAFLKKVFKSKDVEVIIISNKGIAEAYNIGIKKAKGDVIVTFHEDCYPITKNFILNLIKPLEEKFVVASMARIKDYYTNKFYYPLLDGKATAYKKNALYKVNLFDENTFKTGGEDFDMYMKLKTIGQIRYPDCTIVHKHKNHKNKIKTKQLARASGVLFRRYNLKYKIWWKCLILANPLNWNYFISFWKGFLKGKQYD